MILSYLFNHLFMSESSITFSFQSAIDILQFIIQFHFFLHDSSQTDQNILEIILEVYLIDGDAATSLHFLQLYRAFVETTAQCLNAGLGRKQ